jgi:hypothetical protein
LRLWKEDTEMLSVETERLILEVERLLTEYVVFMDDTQPLAVALFALNSYLFDLWDFAPYLFVTSSMPECGKSQVLKVLDCVARAPEWYIDPTPAVLFREIELKSPTALIDESSAATAEQRQATRAVLNAGFEVGRSVKRVKQRERGPDEIIAYNVFCPKAIAGIGWESLHDDTRSRCIPIELRRKLPHEEVKRFRRRKALAETEGLRDRLAVWSLKAREVLAGVEPELPEADRLNSRAADIWEPLFAIADLAGPALAVRARQAAIQLHEESGSEDVGPVALLANLREVFESDPDVLAARGRVSSIDLVSKLVVREDWPWVSQLPRVRADDPESYRNAAQRLSGMLKMFRKPDGSRIAPAKMHVRDQQFRGYDAAWFVEEFERHLGAAEPAKPAVPAVPAVEAVVPVMSVPAVGQIKPVGSIKPVKPVVEDALTLRGYVPVVEARCSNGHVMSYRADGIEGTRCLMCNEPFVVQGRVKS